MHNPDFKPTEFGRFKSEAGYNAFTMSPKDKHRVGQRFQKIIEEANQNNKLIN